MVFRYRGRLVISVQRYELVRKKPKFILSFFEREYLRRSQSTNLLVKIKENRKFSLIFRKWRKVSGGRTKEEGGRRIVLRYWQ